MSKQEFFSNPRDFTIGGSPSFSAIHGNQNNANHYGKGNQHNNFDRGVQNFNYGRDQNMNSGPGSFTVNNDSTRRQSPALPFWPSPIREVQQRPQQQRPPQVSPTPQPTQHNSTSPYHSTNGNDPFTSPLDEMVMSPQELHDEEEAFLMLLQDPQEYKIVIEEQSGDDSQMTLDEWQRIYNQTNRQDVLNPILSSMHTLSRHSGRVPLCTTLRKIDGLSRGPVAYGVFTDGWRGRLKGQDMSLKVLRYRIPHLQNHVASFLRQSMLWRQLDHPNVNSFHGVHYFTEDKQQLCLASPWMENGNLLQYLQTATNVNQLALAKDVAEGLSYLHRMNVVHGALKGFNVLIKPDASACITDFGLVDVLTKQELSGLSTHFTHDQVPARWLAPELMRGGQRKEVTRESDIFAYGYVCYEIYAKHIPFPEYEDFAIYSIVLLEKRRPIRPQQVPEKMWELMNACWSDDSYSRPTTSQLVERVKGIRPDTPSVRPMTPSRAGWNYLNRKRG